MEPSQVTQFFRERMFPQNGWFQSRTASVAEPWRSRHTAATSAAAPNRTE
jgi:hypothetical protein